MPWIVEWTEDARNSLAIVWMAAADREKVTATVAEVDELLKWSPTTFATPRAEQLWLLEKSRLRFHLEVDQDRRLVTVVGVSMKFDA